MAKKAAECRRQGQVNWICEPGYYQHAYDAIHKSLKCMSLPKNGV
jgi:hypothetical protein